MLTTVGRALAGGRPHLMVTDPPYGVNYDPNWRNKAYRHRQRMRPAGRKLGGKALGAALNDDRSDWREAWAHFPAMSPTCGTQACMRGRSLISSAVGFELRAQLIWDKQRPIIGRAHYHWQHEPCWYAVRNGATGHWNGDRQANHDLANRAP